MHVKRLAIYTIIVLGLLTRAALAECTLNKDYTFPLTMLLPTQDRHYSGQASGSRWSTTAIDQIASAIGVGVNTALATCTSGETLIADNNESALLSGGNFFGTTVPGFGLSFQLGSGKNNISLPRGGIATFTLSTSGTYSLNSMFDTISGERDFSYSWQTSEDTAIGGQTAESALALRIITSDGKELIRAYYDSFNVNIGSCRVNSWDKEVDFGAVRTRTLKVAGSTGKEASFNINLYCSSAKRIPSITFEGRTDSAYTTVFTNPSGDEYAQGVGVQLLKDGNVITPGEKVSLKVLYAGLKDYEFSSRVFRLNRELTVGAIDVPVTFTMTYE
ncbi:fimbrial family protein [Klebsiella oxytoca]|nr:fimbrial family protein [Klebsiella oxytoca]